MNNKCSLTVIVCNDEENFFKHKCGYGMWRNDIRLTLYFRIQTAHMCSIAWYKYMVYNEIMNVVLCCTYNEKKAKILVT